MERTIALFTPPLIMMNALAGIVSAVWLFVLGQWQIPVYGLIVTIIFPFAYAIVTLPLALVFGLGANALKNAKMNKASSGTMLVFNALSDVIHFGWVLLVFSFLLSVMVVENLALLPILLAGYAISTGGLTAMASREQDNEFTMMSTFILQAVTFLVVVYILFGVEILTLPTMIVGMIVHGAIVNKVFKAENEYHSFFEYEGETRT